MSLVSNDALQREESQVTKREQCPGKVAQKIAIRAGAHVRCDYTPQPPGGFFLATDIFFILLT